MIFNVSDEICVPPHRNMLYNCMSSADEENLIKGGIYLKHEMTSIEAFHEQLKKWSGTTIHITKQESQDWDHIYLELTNVTFHRQQPDIDGYRSRYILQLHGKGNIQNDDETMQPLPDDTYDIPLQDTAMYEWDGNQFTISTERALYKIAATTQA